MKAKAILFGLLLLVNALVFWSQLSTSTAIAGEPVWVEKCLRTECETDGTKCWIPIYY